jgi:hypothetical protein
MLALKLGRIPPGRFSMFQCELRCGANVAETEQRIVDSVHINSTF